MELRTIIIDDDKNSINSLEILLKEHPYMINIGNVHTAKQAEKLIFSEHPDVVFLDIELPDDNGVLFWKKVSERIDWNIKVVFYTAFDEYMIDAIRESAFDYLLKPIKEEDFNVVITRIRNAGDCLSNTIIGHKYIEENKQVFGIRNIRNEIQLLRMQNIGFFFYDSQRKLWNVVLDNLVSITLKKGTTSEIILKNSNKFVQIHPSYIINIDYLMMISENHCKLFPPFNNIKDLIISRSHMKQLISLVDTFY